MTKRRVILVHIADSHGGHRLGLLNPETVLYAETEDGELAPYDPVLTESQKYLWRNYTQSIALIAELAGQDDIILIHNGDETNGNKYPQQLVSTRMADQIVIARDNFAPWYKLPNLKSVRIVAGTAAHSFSEGSSAILIQQQLQAMYPEVNTGVLYHGLLDIDGFLVDYAHHGPGPGNRNWLRGNVARFYLRDLMQREIMKRRQPPDLVLRGHYHHPVYEYLETEGYASRLYIAAPLCMNSEHSIQVVSSPEAITTGMVAIEIVDGKFVNDYRLYDTVDVRTKETL